MKPTEPSSPAAGAPASAPTAPRNGATDAASPLRLRRVAIDTYQIGRAHV